MRKAVRGARVAPTAGGAPALPDHHPVGPDDDGAGPIDALIRAVQAYDANAIQLALAPRVKLSVPPLRIHVQGAPDVAGAVWEVVDAFDHVTYRLRSRYLTPGSVTDEAVITGVHTRGLLGAPPTGRLGTVPLRVIAHHDGELITSIDVWPDVAAVRGLCDELASHIDQRRAGAAGAMISELRATIPAGAAKVTRGPAREFMPSVLLPVQAPGSDASGAPAGTRPATSAGPERTPGRTPGRTAGRTEGLKPPRSRRIRQVQAVASGAVMLVASVAIITWVATGALRTPPGDTVLTYPEPTGTPTASSTGAAGRPAVAPGAADRTATPGTFPTTVVDATTATSTAGAGVVSATSTPGASVPARKVTIVGDQAVLASDLLFPFGKATLTAEARTQLADLLRQIRAEKRRGAITVNGYTDNVGRTDANLALSRARAAAVAAVLRKGLPDVTVTSNGFGTQHPAAPNTSKAGRAKNRRVTVKLPPPSR